jgi:hypothetical protein
MPGFLFVKNRAFCINFSHAWHYLTTGKGQQPIFIKIGMLSLYSQYRICTLGRWRAYCMITFAKSDGSETVLEFFSEHYYALTKSKLERWASSERMTE